MNNFLTLSMSHSLHIVVIIFLFIVFCSHQSLAFSSLNVAQTSSRRGHATSKTSTSLQSSIATATGDADRAFRLGIQLEKAGLARAASAAFHEAATLYQCFLDQPKHAEGDDAEQPTNIFQHVTSLASNEEEEGSTSSPTVLAGE